MFNFLTPSNPFTWLNYSYLCFAKPQMSSNGVFLYFANVCLLIAYVLLRFRHKKSLGSGFGCHYHGWGCSNFLWNIAVFCGHKKGWKHPQASVKISTCAYISYCLGSSITVAESWLLWHFFTVLRSHVRQYKQNFDISMLFCEEVYPRRLSLLMMSYNQ